MSERMPLRSEKQTHDPKFGVVSGRRPLQCPGEVVESRNGWPGGVVEGLANVPLNPRKSLGYFGSETETK